MVFFFRSRHRLRISLFTALLDELGLLSKDAGGEGIFLLQFTPVIVLGAKKYGAAVYGSPTEGLVLGVDQISVDCFLGAGADVVHGSDPGHLVEDFESFCDALSGGHLADQQFQHIVGLLVDPGQVGA